MATRPRRPGRRARTGTSQRRGKSYTNFRFTTHLIAAGVDASIGSVGDAYDNALMESTIGLYKTELIKPRRPWTNLSQVEMTTAEWIDWHTHNLNPLPHPEGFILGGQGRTA